MENKINVAKLLKECPSGMELDCMMYENLYFNSLNADYDGTINCYTLIDGIKTSINFTEYGTFNNHKGAKCVIFPKGKTTWEGFKLYFKDGDVVATNNGTWIGITSGGTNHEYIPTYCVIKDDGKFEAYFDTMEEWSFGRLAIEEEKEKLFKAIKDNGYKWNEDTKTLEKLVEPKFKVGDRIKSKNIYTNFFNDKRIFTITEISRGRYWSNRLAIEYIEKQDEWELAPDKFVSNALKPFDKVLVRDDNTLIWINAFFGFYNTVTNKKYPFVASGVNWAQCIPYEGNEHLLGTTNDCDDYFKNW